MDSTRAYETTLLLAISSGLAAYGVWALKRRTSADAAAAARLLQQLEQVQELLKHEQKKRASERAGRIRAEQRLKQANLQLTGLTAAAGFSRDAGGSAHTAGEANPSGTCSGGSSSAGTNPAQQQQQQQQRVVYPFVPIGVLRSCFNDRRGTPRQPHLVPGARAVLRLCGGVPPACLTGLEGFSHCWVVYVFHENTDLAKLLAARAAPGGSSRSSSHVKALVSVPRLNGSKLGVLATRSPHRPVPIGLSTAQIVSVDATSGVLVLGGVDVVDGSPVLDIKPYVPFSDALVDATAPGWVAAASDDEPLALSGVTISEAAAAAIHSAWQDNEQHSLYDSGGQLVELVEQVLSRDIRSMHQRRDVAPVSSHPRSQQTSSLAQRQQHAQQQGVLGDRGRRGVHDDLQGPEPGACMSQQGQLAPQQQAAGTSQSSRASGPLYSVTLDGVEVWYSLDACSGRLTVIDAASKCRRDNHGNGSAAGVL